MKYEVDFDKCKSHGNCMAEAPDIFEVRDDGFLYFLDENPTEDKRERLEAAARACPTGAITVAAQGQD